MQEVAVGTGRRLTEGVPHEGDVAVLSIGPIGNDVQAAIKALQESGQLGSAKVFHYDMRFLKPLDEQILEEVGQHFKHIITVEDGVRCGGMGSAVLEWMSDHGYTPTMVRLGLPDQFVEQGTVAQLRHLCGIDRESIQNEIIKAL